ncbi:hypothetical protein M0R72_20680 [Candidatus Pacearchaeota archaeon]|jgi:hypothetical protein|nr:hypothetical protein [Candidatus Pacearchaeota archaeon]
MGTTARLHLEKLVAGASNRANLISYWNSNADILDTLVQIVDYEARVGSANSGLVGDTTGIRFSHSGWTAYGTAIRSIVTIATPGYQNPRLGFFTQAHNTYLITDMIERMSILADTGYIGMGGITAPVCGLELPNAATTGKIKCYDIYAHNNVSALTFTDRTPQFTGDALAAIRKIKATEKGEIDHATLPDFAVNPYQDERGEWWPGRSLGDMVSVLTVAIQQLAVNYDAAIAERDLKIEKLSKRIDALAAEIEKN